MPNLSKSHYSEAQSHESYPHAYSFQLTFSSPLLITRYLTTNNYQDTWGKETKKSEKITFEEKKYTKKTKTTQYYIQR